VPTRFDDSRPLAPIHFKTAVRQRPEFIRESIAAVFALPLIAGVLALIGIGLVCWGLGLPVKVALIISGIAIIAAGVIWQLDAKDIMHTQETIEGIEPPLQPPPLPPQSTVPYLYRKGPRQLEAGDWGITPELFTEWCRAGYSEQSLAFGKWVCRFGQVYPGSGRTKFETFRSLWASQGYGEDRGGNKGFGFTGEGIDHAAGWLFSQGLLQQLDPTPLPAQLGTGEPE
jgi:hypothetical protein